MNKEQATQFVIKELGKHHNKNEIIVTLCEQMKINWRDAEKFISEVELQHKRSIASKQSPLIIFLSVMVLIGGLYLTINNGLYFFQYFITTHDTFSITGALDLRILYLRIGSFITGISMFLGGAIGLGKLFSKFS